MKNVLVSLLVGVTLCGGLFGCGEETVSKAKYDEVVKSNEQLENKEALHSANVAADAANKK